MFNKLGRAAGGGGRGGGKRPIPPPSSHRPPAPGGRMPIGGAGRGRPGTGAAAAAPPAREETFSLTQGVPDFAAIIKLTPDIVEEIRRAEAEGGSAKIKFDSNINNIPGNVINVGGKEFRFTWAREPGDLCDIYEERRNGEDGHGLLVESGSAWRKLTVQRILDESTKNHVKKRSEEAERLMRSRKAIVLDPTNPSVKSQVKSMAAAGVEGSMRRMNWKQKKEPLPKKRKVEPNQAPLTGTPKLPTKPGASSNITLKSRLSTSPPVSPHERLGHGTSISPSGPCNSTNPEDISASGNRNEEAGNMKKGVANNFTHGATHEPIGRKWVVDGLPMDLTSTMINILSENPKGITLQALEEALGEESPGSEMIESILENISTFQAPGRYFLKPGVRGEGTKRRVSEIGSSPEIAHGQTSAADLFSTKGERYENQNQMGSKAEDDSDPFEKIEANQNEQDHYISDINVNNDSKERACSSSESGSGSDSESDSSDSGSDSGSQSKSRSKSKSPGGSRSASSSDSESDVVSFSSKEVSDVEVELVASDNEKGNDEDKTEPANLMLPFSPGLASHDEHGPIDIIGNNQEGQVTTSPLDLKDSERDLEIENAIEVSEHPHVSNTAKSFEESKVETYRGVEMDPYQRNTRLSDESMSSPDQYKKSESQRIPQGRKLNGATVSQSLNEKQNMINDRPALEHSNFTDVGGKTKFKRASGSEYPQERAENVKRSKASAQVIPSQKNKDDTISESTFFKSPERPRLDAYPDHTVAVNNVECDGNIDTDSHVRSRVEFGRSAPYKDAHRIQQSPDFWSSSSLEAEKSGPRASDFSARRKAQDTENSTRCTENFDASNVKNLPIQDKMFALKDRPQKDMFDDVKYPVKNVREIFSADKNSSVPESYSRRSAESSGHSKDNRHPSSMRKSEIDKSLAVSGKGVVLRRELSDLELGEFREPPGEDLGRVQGQFERNDSFKRNQSKNIPTDNTNLNISKGRNAANTLLELKKQSPAKLRTGVHGNHDGLNKRVPVDDFMDSTQTQQRAIPPQSQQISRVDHADPVTSSLLEKPTEIDGRNDTRMGLEKQAGAKRKIPASALQQNDIKHVGRTGNKTVKDSKPQNLNNIGDTTYQSINDSSLENQNNVKRGRESSSDEDNSFYSKYDKEKPELRGPIKDFSQYKEYVGEYREKYERYCTLSKNLEKMSNNFLKVGNDLSVAKEKDQEKYYMIREQLREMYRNCGEKHKKMKKVFILLHDEVKNLKQRIYDFVQAYTKD